MHLVQELLETYSTVVVQEVLQRRQESWRWGAQRLGFGSEQRPNERVIEADPLTSTQEVAKELNVAILWLFCIWSKLGRWKSLISECFMTWPQIKKKSFWSVVFSYPTQQQWTIFQSDCDVWWKVDFIWEPAMTRSVVGQRRSSKSTFQSQTCTKKRSWSLFCGLLPLWSTTAFWIPAKPLHLWSMLSTSMRYTKNCSVCRWHSSPRQCLTACYNASKAERIGLWSFASSSIFTWHLTNWWLFLQASQQLFAGKMLPQLTVRRKCFPIVCQIPKQGFLCYKNKQTYFSLTEMCWL